MSLVKQVTSFAVEIDGKVQNFSTEKEALAALARPQFQARAEAYTAASGLEGKQAVGRQNVITDFLAFEATQVEAEVPAEQAE